MENVKVFLIHYAGASSLAYFSWLTLFPDSVKPVVIEYKGRGCRADESFYRNVKEAVTDVVDQIQRELTADTPYIIYGHSMGTLFAFEAYYELKRRGVHYPLHMIVSGRQAPQIPLPPVPYSELPDKEFIEVVSKFGGVPKEFNDPAVMAMFMPILRADFRIIEEYTCSLQESKIECDMTAIFGDQDFSTKEEDVQAWSVHAGKKFDIIKMKGPQYFIHDHADEIVDLISSKALTNVSVIGQ